MKSEWKECTIGDIGTIVTGKTPSTRHAEWWGGAVPFVTPKDIQGTKHCLATERYVTEAGVGVVASAKLPPHAVCVSCIGNIGYVAMTTKECISNQQVNSIIVNEKYDCDFVYYLMKSLWPFFKNYEGQSTALSILNKTAFSRLSVSTPPLPTQRKIAAVLSSLDDKIETNNAICRNLEEQADALFKAWFVDFSFHASGKWRDSEMGAIPDGWSVHHMDDFFDIRTGKKDANVAGASGKYPFFSCAQDILWTDEYSFEGNAILVAGNGDFNVKRYVGKFEAYQRTYVLIPDKPLLSGILYYAIKAGLKDITSEARGSVIKFITKGSIAKFTIALPADVEKWSVTSALNNINTQIDILTEERRKLASLRNTLLPRLMSGVLDVSAVKL